LDARRIKIIIGLMTLSLIGIISLQVYWINWNVRLNEGQFDKSVYDALNTVGEKLQAIDEANAAEQDNAPTPPQSYIQIDPASRKIRASSVDSTQNTPFEPSLEDSGLRWEAANPTALADARPLASRIGLEVLTQAVKEQLSSRGIQAEHQFGVYSKARESYVIVNDHYVVEEPGVRPQQGGVPNLFNSKYVVALFPKDVESPGYLSLYFPSRTSVVFGSVLRMLALSVLFTGIILYCFWYTIRVIYRQKQLSEIKNDFINNMTHEFKTPIATISLASDMIDKPVVLNNPEKFNKLVSNIRNENKRMNNLVERVLQMALVDKKEFELSIGEVDVHELILYAAESFRIQIEDRQGALHLELNAMHSVIQGDATHLSSVVHNLLDNANKYSPGQPDITIETRDTEFGVELRVRDKGVGIGAEARKLVFDKFYRVPTGNLHNVKGFGLGLSYVKAIITAHRGLVDVRSDVGKGSEFIVSLPMG
jgi:two-component system, OmpR family, phosphate regulon sensor histidine kinase PhoR